MDGDFHEYITDIYYDPNKPPIDRVYEFEEIIGEGTSSDVVRAVHNEAQKRYAIKIIDKSKITSLKQKLRIQNEIRLHKKCQYPSSCPYIVKFIEPYESDLDVCLVMELCEGGELFERLFQKGYMCEKQASRIIKQLAIAVKHLHSMGIVHRDIKPENIIFVSRSEDSDIKLVDFGLAKQIDETQKQTSGREFLKASSSGTAAYCAPERLNQSHESKAVDMWSIGCILYFLLYGVPPFFSNNEDEDEHDDEIIEAVLQGNIKFPDTRKISPLATDLIMRLLEKDPSKRLSAEHVLQHPWIRSHTLSEASATEPPTVNTREQLKLTINKIIDVEAGEQGEDEESDAQKGEEGA